MQGLRFIMVGLASNILLYLLYLTLTASGAGHKSAMTLLFFVGAVQTFFFNKRWTFAHQGLLQSTFFKYVALYSFAYLLNLVALLVFVDNFGYPHQVVQGMMILIIALLLFILQKHWVFRGILPASQMKKQRAA